MASYEELQELVIRGQKDKVKDVVNSLLGSGKSPMEIISAGLYNPRLDEASQTCRPKRYPLT